MTEEFDFTAEELDTDVVEEFYNAFHDKSTGRFTFAKGGKKGKLHVPFSEASRRSYAIAKSLGAARKSKEYKTAQARAKGSWADREKGQGGMRGVKGYNSKKADTARAANAKKGAMTKKGNPNKDGSEALKGAYKITGNKTQDAINITRLDRGSPERAKAVKAFEKAHGGK
jgi:hypothetical protein